MSDLIGRHAAIDQIECLMDDKTKVHYNHGCADAIATLKNLPPAQQWIPVSEKMPEARRSVILSTKNWTGEGCYWETTEHHVIWKGYRWNATYWDDEVDAWMPLPEPYQGEE